CQLGIFLNVMAEDRFTALDAAIGQALAKLETSAAGIATGEDGARLTPACDQRLELQLPLRALRQSDGAALSVEYGNRIMKDRLQQLFFFFDVDKMMAGTEQSHQLFAGAGAALTIEGQSFEGFFPGRLGGGLDVHFLDCVTIQFRFAIAEDLNDSSDFAELNEVADTQRPGTGTQTHTIKA